jgi:replication factor A1
MEKSKSDLYNLISDLLTEEEFERRIQERADSYEGLLNEDAIAYLIVDELGRNVIAGNRISDLKNGDNISLTAVVEGVGEIREFSRKDGTTGRVANLSIADDSGRCRFTLWDRDVELINKMKITKGTRIKIVNGYVKITDFGTDISTGRWGMFSVEE